MNTFMTRLLYSFTKTDVSCSPMRVDDFFLYCHSRGMEAVVDVIVDILSIITQFYILRSCSPVEVCSTNVQHGNSTGNRTSFIFSI